MSEPMEPQGEPQPPASEEKPDGGAVWRDITGVGSRIRSALLVPALALVSALLIGGFIIAVSDTDLLKLWGEDPGAAFSDTLALVGRSYKALFDGSLGSANAVSETLFAATPLILAGLAVAVGFQAGLFNIGGEGQMLAGGMVGLYIGFTLSVPTVLHIPLALIGAVIGGGIWGGISGLLKARTGAHEVITTIMLNFIALFFVDYLLKSSIFQQPGRADPISKSIETTAQLPRILGSSYRVTLGFLIALAAAGFVYWLLYKSSIGFEFRAVGYNPDAAKYAGMNVVWLYVGVMAVAGALAGIGGANQIMGLPPYQGSSGFSGQIGFDAIALALLGRSHPVGVVWAGLLFGALTAGGRQLQGAELIPIDLVVVIQALIIVFIAAPALVRAMYRIKGEGEAAEQLTRGWAS
ncbi:MAG: ABC transporter permease [Acidimicrobiia bacterium]|nr:ABC transporter permease [Acidimicrobiia bacterium]